MREGLKQDPNVDEVLHSKLLKMPEELLAVLEE